VLPKWNIPKSKRKKPYTVEVTSHSKIVRGNKSYEGKISVWQSELEAMVQDAPGKSILNLNFDIIVSYVPEDGGVMVTDVLSGCEFTETKKAMKQGDKNMIVELPVIFLEVKPQQ